MSDTIDSANELSYQNHLTEVGGITPERQAEIDAFDAEYDRLDAERAAGNLNEADYVVSVAALKERIEAAKQSAPKVEVARFGGAVALEELADPFDPHSEEFVVNPDEPDDDPKVRVRSSNNLR